MVNFVILNLCYNRGCVHVCAITELLDTNPSNILISCVNAFPISRLLQSNVYDRSPVPVLSDSQWLDGMFTFMVYARLMFSGTCLTNKTFSLLFSAHVVRLPVLCCLVLQQCVQCCVGNNCNRRLLTGGATSNHMTTSVTTMAVAVATALLLLRH